MYRRLKTYAALPAVIFTVRVGCLPLDMNDQIRQFGRFVTGRAGE